MKITASILAGLCLLLLSFNSAGTAGTPPLFSDDLTYEVHSNLVCTSVFHWYTSYSGQLSGPWLPYDGRYSWTGKTTWWKEQLKQMMKANIDVLFVHVIESFETERVNLFRAMSDLRSEGYDVPKVAPFLDPMIIWYSSEKVNLATPAGKDEFMRHYIRFFQQYYSVNTDIWADDYIFTLDGKVVLDTWHVQYNTTNLSSFTRSDAESRLQAQFAASHPIFNNGIHMIVTAPSDPTLSFADEKIVQFAAHSYYYPFTFNGITTTQVKGGYWDQNIRNPGYQMKRDGGTFYSDAWNQVNSNPIDHVYIESWNEYDEGSGIYAANPNTIYIAPGSGNTNTDKWSNTNNPFEYIDTTARGAAVFNESQDLDSRILWHNIPDHMYYGEQKTVQVVVRNQGDHPWTSTEEFAFGRQEQLDQFGPSRIAIDDASNQIPYFGGIFRGRPITFEFTIQPLVQDGTYELHWGMFKGDEGFGEILETTIQVETPSSISGWDTMK